jgi:hypothetical protein
VGAAQKQEQSQIEKFADLLTDPKKHFVTELEKRQTALNEILRRLT